MPSILANHCSESVSLVTSDVNPYDPPHRISQEKASLNSSNNTGSTSNGYIDGPNGNKRVEGVFIHETNGTNRSLQSLPNGRSGESIENVGAIKQDGRQFGPNALRGSGESGRRSSDLVNGVAGTPSGDTTSTIGSANRDTPLPRPKSPETGQIGDKRASGHKRNHSSSAPQAPTPRIPDSVDAHTKSSASGSDLAGMNSAPASTKPGSTYPPINAPPAARSSASSLHPSAPRLQHRHTLEVPRVSTGGSSRDFSLPTARTSHDAFNDTGRFSPTHSKSGRLSSNLARAPTHSVNSDMYLDEIPQDGDMARWTEAIRQKRASRRKRKEEEEDDRVVVGTKVDMHHVNWVTAYNMLTGIRFTVSRTNAKMDRDLTDGDFDARHKFSFDITGNELTPSAKYDFKFKDYAPWVFRHLRARFGLDPADYLMSLTSKYILSELGSPGKSGSFFYFSRDYKYIIKTIHHAEHKVLRKVLREYYAHVERHPNTLISQFYGLHRVKIPYGRKIHFVIMNNLFPPHRDIHQTFDLKGSTIGRDFKEEDLERNPRATLKDLNWLRRNYHFEFGPRKKDLFIEQMKRDVALLQKLKIMDYSLLVGIHDMSKGNEENLRDKTLQVFQPGGERDGDPQPNMLTRTPSKLENARKNKQLRQIIRREKPVPMEKSTSKMPEEMLDEKKNFIFYSDDGGLRATHEDGQPGEEIYYLGIIDCLTHYGFIKRAEHMWKGLSNPKSQISPIPPPDYGDRFVKFITGITMTREEAERQATERAEGLDGSSEMGQSASGRESHQFSRRSTDKVMEKAEKQAIKSEKEGASEDLSRDRTIGIVRSPSAERSGGIAGATLPVVEEAGEAGSREESIRDEKPHDSPAMGMVQAAEKSGDLLSAAASPPFARAIHSPPLATEERSSSLEAAHTLDGMDDQPPPTPAKDKRARPVSMNKQLPSLPHIPSARLSMGFGLKDSDASKQP